MKLAPLHFQQMMMKKMGMVSQDPRQKRQTDSKWIRMRLADRLADMMTIQLGQEQQQLREKFETERGRER